MNNNCFICKKEEDKKSKFGLNYCITRNWMTHRNTNTKKPYKYEMMTWRNVCTTCFKTLTQKYDPELNPSTMCFSCEICKDPAARYSCTIITTTTKDRAQYFHNDCFDKISGIFS